MKGTLLAQFATEGGLGAAAIRYLTAGDVSHVDLVVPRNLALQYERAVPRGQYLLLGARLDGGVQLRPGNYAKFTRTIRKSVQAPDIDAAYDFAFAQIGKPYAKMRIVDFFLHKFGKPDGFNPNRKTWFCDELLYEIVNAGGVQLLGEKNPLNLSPQAVMESPLWKTVQAA